jgi:chromosome segregation ATPase
MEFQPMSPDEIERPMQFLLRQQAQFEASMASLTARQDRFQTHLDQFQVNLDRFQANLEGFQTNLEGSQARLGRLEAKTENLADGLIGLTGIVGQLINKVDRVVDAFERHLRVDHGYLPS